MQKWIFILLCISNLSFAKALLYETQWGEQTIPVFEIYKMKLNAKLPINTTLKQLTKTFGKPSAIKKITKAQYNDWCAELGTDIAENDRAIAYYHYDKTQFVVYKSGKVFLQQLDFSSKKFYLELPNKQRIDNNTSYKEIMQHYPSINEDELRFIAPCAQCDGDLLDIELTKDNKLKTIMIRPQC